MKQQYFNFKLLQQFNEIKKAIEDNFIDYLSMNLYDNEVELSDVINDFINHTTMYRNDCEKYFNICPVDFFNLFLLATDNNNSNEINITVDHIVRTVLEFICFNYYGRMDDLFRKYATIENE